MTYPRRLLYAVVAAPFLAGAACCASADELRLDPPTSHPALSTDVDAAVAAKSGGGGGQSSDSDLAARVDALESARAAVKPPGGPGVSLSVSGWVSEQVQISR